MTWLKKYGIWLLMAVFGLIYSFYAVVRHLRFESFIFDLGVYDQEVWLASRFKPLFSSVLEAPFFADHLTPSLVLLAPLYWVWDNVVMLLIFQALFAVWGAYPVYLLAKKKLESEAVALVMAFGYLAFYGLQNAIAFDFHPIVLATTMLAWLLWAYEEKKVKLFWLLVLLIGGLQENFWLLLAALGVFLMVRFRDFKKGTILVLGSLLIFGGYVLVLVPAIGLRPFTYLPTHLQTLDLGQIGRMLVWPETKLEVIGASFLAFGLVPVLSPSIFILLGEEFIQRFVGTAISTRWQLGYQYNVILAPILVWGAIEAIKRYKLNRKLVIGLIVVGIVSVQVATKPALNDLVNKDFYNFAEVADSKAVIERIPNEASVAAANNLGPYLTHREKIIFLTNCVEDTEEWWVDVKRCYKLKADYLVANLSPKVVSNSFYPDYSREKIERYFEMVQKSGEYKLIFKQNEAYLLERVSK